MKGFSFLAAKYLVMWSSRPVRAARDRRIDIGLLLGVLALLLIGLPVIYSASHITEGMSRALHQAIWAACGLLGMGVIACVDYRVWRRHWQALFVITLLMLIATLFSRPINGAHSWLGIGSLRMEPGEFAKFTLILALASFLTRAGESPQSWPVFLRSILLIAVPALLVMAQPDLGSGLILCAIWAAMVWIAGARWWMLTGVIIGAALVFALAWNIHLPGGRALIKEYQKKRLDFAHADPVGSGYHQLQARIAIGAGKGWGKGYLQGTQAQRGFLPEQDTDFIYAVIGEEFGFLGCVLVLGLYIFVLWRLLAITEEAETLFGRLIAGGIVALLAAHLVINVGMNLTLSPVTGIPLPFLSYGGSNLVTNLLAIGVALNISRHRQSRRDWAPVEPLIHA